MKIVGLTLNNTRGCKYTTPMVTVLGPNRRQESRLSFPKVTIRLINNTTGWMQPFGVVKDEDEGTMYLGFANVTKGTPGARRLRKYSSRGVPQLGLGRLFSDYPVEPGGYSIERYTEVNPKTGKEEPVVDKFVTGIILKKK